MITSRGGGRTFAGDPSDWGLSFTVGEVPVYKYLASRDVDEVGFTLRTASLMSGPENEFDDGDPADYELFGIRWTLLLPCRRWRRPDAYRRTSSRSADAHTALWDDPDHSRLLVQVVDTRASVARELGGLGLVLGSDARRPLLDAPDLPDGRL